MTTQFSTQEDRDYISRITQIESQLANAEKNYARRNYEPAQTSILRAELFLSQLPQPTTDYQRVSYDSITEKVEEARILISGSREKN